MLPSRTALIAAPHELHGFMIEGVRAPDPGSIALDFADGSKAFFCVELLGYSELKTPLSELDKIAGHRLDNVHLQIHSQDAEEIVPGADYVLAAKIITSNDGPELTLHWELGPSAEDIISEGVVTILLDPKLDP